jgi:hypothetical protein
MKKYKKLVYTAHSGETAKYTKYIMRFVYRKGYIPINPYETMDYYMLTWLIHRGNKKKVIDDTISVMLHCDELWVFGQNKNQIEKEGVEAEVKIWKKYKDTKKIRFFTWKEVGVPKFTPGSKWNL